MLNRRGIIASIFGTATVLWTKGFAWAKHYVAEPIIRVQSWPFGEELVGEWWSCELPKSKSFIYEDEIKKKFGTVFTKVLGDPTTKYRTWREENFRQNNSDGELVDAKEYVAFGFAGDSPHEDKPDVSEKEFLDKLVQRYNEVFRVHPSRNRIVRTTYFTDPEEARYLDLWDAAYDTSTVELQKQLATICKWGV